MGHLGFPHLGSSDIGLMNRNYEASIIEAYNLKFHEAFSGSYEY